MTKSKTRRPGNQRHNGRVTQTPCKALGGGRYCEPLHRVVIAKSDGLVDVSYAACTCGRRFSSRCEDLAASAEAIREGATPAEVATVISNLWPADRVSAWGKVGVVPVGTPVLHSSCRPVAPEALGALEPLKVRLEHTMRVAEGIGLAANQVGADLRVISHNFARIAPPVLANPVVFASSGQWSYVEGCLSLDVEGTRCEILRPKQIAMRADLLDGRSIVIDADEYVSRVLQHELDHIDGIEYVQRAVGAVRSEVYRVMDESGVDIGWLPPRPY